MFILAFLFLFSFAQIASAHDVEEPPGLSDIEESPGLSDIEESPRLSNIQVLIISAASSLVFFILFVVVKKYDVIMARSSLYSLVLFTSTVHILLGLDDSLLIVGGVGALSVTFFPLVSNFSKRIYQIADLALALIVLSMFIGYFVYSHDLHYILEDYLGITTKLVELSILFVLAKQHVFAGQKTEA